MTDRERHADAGQDHCLLIEPTDPRLKEGSEATQAAMQALQQLGWTYGETREEGIVVTQRFTSEQDFLEAFDEASNAVSSQAALQEVPCESIYGS